MCGIWTAKQWEDATKVPGSKYSVVGRFQNAEGQTALQIKETHTDDSYYWNVYSKDGQKTGLYYTQGEANTAMQDKGFNLVAEATAQVDTAGVILGETTTPENQTTPDDGVVRVQGRTFEEWAQVGRDNGSRKQEDRIHPEHPRNHGEDRMATEDEMKAFELSLPDDEQELFSMIGLLSILS